MSLEIPIGIHRRELPHSLALFFEFWVLFDEKR